MALYAVDRLDDAIDATRDFLFPFEVGRWLRLALLALFIGGGSFGASGAPPTGVPGGTDGGTGTPGGDPGLGQISLSNAEIAAIVAVVGVLVLIGLAFALLASIFEFAFVEALRTDEVSIRSRVRAFFGRGLRLFGFRIGLGLVGLLAAAAILVPVFLPVLQGDAALSVGLLFLALPVLLVLGAVLGVVNGFTTVFVVPIMLVEDRGVVSAWKRFWPTLRAEWKQYLVYAVAGFVLNVVAGIGAGTAIGIGALILAIPFVIVGVIAFFIPLLGIFIIALLAFVYAALLVVLGAVVQVPIQSYLRLYALFVLGDSNPEFDLIPRYRDADDETPVDAA